MQETNELTKLGINDLMCRIVTKTIIPPKEMNPVRHKIDEMMAWVIGYQQSMQEILTTIEEMRGD